MKKLLLLVAFFAFSFTNAQSVDDPSSYFYRVQMYGTPDVFEADRFMHFKILDTITEGENGNHYYHFKLLNKNDLKLKQTQVWRLSDSLNSKLKKTDIYTWAKQPNPPSYGKSDVGLSNVDNTSDLSKPISTATQIALNTKLSVEVDGSITNELQTISKVGDNLTISNGNTIALGIPIVKRQESYSGTTNSSGQYTVVFSSSYSVTPNIQANIIGAPDNQNIRITSIGTTGFTVTVRNRVDVVGLLPTWSNVNGALVDVLITQK